MKTIMAEIPEDYLLEIATHGRLGTGELGDLIRIWAEKEAIKNGLGQKLHEEKQKKICELRKNIQNVLGKDAINKLDELIDTGKTALHFAEQIKSNPKQ